MTFVPTFTFLKDELLIDDISAPLTCYLAHQQVKIKGQVRRI